tara:strand:+ start:710 stop:958 length:249 start_codon:yes stop_codon:yes gene_type:complete
MKVIHKDLDKIIEIWSIKLNGIERTGPTWRDMHEVYYEVHVEINHNPADGERRITDIFPEYGEVTDAIRKKLEEEVQKIEVI